MTRVLFLLIISMSIMGCIEVNRFSEINEMRVISKELKDKYSTFPEKYKTEELNYRIAPGNFKFYGISDNAIQDKLCATIQEIRMGHNYKPIVIQFFDRQETHVNGSGESVQGTIIKKDGNLLREEKLSD